MCIVTAHELFYSLNATGGVGMVSFGELVVAKTFLDGSVKSSDINKKQEILPS